MDKLYLNDSYIKTFEANILDILDMDGKTLVVLDRTAFYPEGGGQPSDTGTIGDTTVSYVFEQDNTIYHVVDKKPLAINNVECCINWDRRFDHMQQHCGQHILSASFMKVLNGATVGFHLGSDFVTVDIAVESITYDEAIKVEQLANNIVFSNAAVKHHYPAPHELSKFNLRKAPSVTEDIRIVEVEDFDFSPCGGTHPDHTGDIGLIKIRKWEKYKSSIRVEFVCGNRALYDYSWKNDSINKISALLSSKDIDVADNAQKIVRELHEANKELKQLRDKVLSYEAHEIYNNSDIINGVHVVKQFYIDRDFKDLTSLAGKISKYPSVVILLGLKSDNARMVFARSLDLNLKINDLFKEVVSLINGKGGGSPESAQGGGPDVSNLESALDAAYIILKNRYLK